MAGGVKWKGISNTGGVCKFSDPLPTLVDMIKLDLKFYPFRQTGSGVARCLYEDLGLNKHSLYRAVLQFTRIIQVSAGIRLKSGSI